MGNVRRRETCNLSKVPKLEEVVELRFNPWLCDLSGASCLLGCAGWSSVNVVSLEQE